MVRADRTFDRLLQAKVSDSDRTLVDQILAVRPSLRDRLAELLPPSIEMHNIRHHGDFHLGQILVVRDDIFIIDFEGEPRRTLAERRMKAPAARDVAGLIRSIDYSVTSAMERALKVSADEDGRLADALTAWRGEATQTFLAAYYEAMSDQRLWPQDREAAENTLRFFLLEKAFYEIEYELAHRPDWLRVALSGALRVLRKQDQDNV
jgi:maltose alpha-D-glucosyltransferase/alpha-amylase